MAREAGFELARVASVQPLSGARAAALAALAEGRLAGMAWMDRDWIERATDADTFLAGARTVLVVGLPCAGEPPSAPAGGPARGRIARYAAGRDYHRVFESKLRRLARRIGEEFGGVARATVDYGPLLERPWAAAAGLGWQGKSTMLLVPGLGPWVLIGVVVTGVEVEPDAPLRKSCGSCTRCIAACPTGAISPEGNVLDARLCISYHTIENRGPIPRELRPKVGDWVFGCDDCLTSCPVGWGASATHPDFLPGSVDDARPVLAELLALDEGAFGERFRGRAIMRAKRDGLARNACVALGNVGTEEDLVALAGALADASPLVRGHAAWGIARIVERGAAGERGRADAFERLQTALATETDAMVIEEIRAALQTIGAVCGF
jgi:epoxyqueuosine reductase